MGMLFVSIILILVFDIFVYCFFRNRNNKIRNIVLVLPVMLLLFIFIISSVDFDRSYDMSNVSMRGNKNINVKILKVDDKQIELSVTNYDDAKYSYTDYFICSKNKKDKWINIRFKWNVGFSKHIFELEEGKSTIRVIKWKDYYGQNLKKGKYQLYWIDQLEFEI